MTTNCRSTVTYTMMMEAGFLRHQYGATRKATTGVTPPTMSRQVPSGRVQHDERPSATRADSPTSRPLQATF